MANKKKGVSERILSCEILAKCNTGSGQGCLIFVKAHEPDKTRDSILEVYSAVRRFSRVGLWDA